MTARPPESGLTVARELQHAATAAPDAAFLRTRGSQLTYRECANQVQALATRMRDEEVRPGCVVALLMGTSIEQVVLWFALSHLGAVHAPLNTALAGDLLVHALLVSRAEVLVVDHAHRAAADDAIGRLAAPPRLLDLDALVRGASADGQATEPADVDELATATLLFTSGTTGRSKACALSHRYLVRQAQLHARSIGATADDVLFTPFPLFHIDAATLTVCAALAVRGTAALAARFSASTFWDDVRSLDATVFNFMGATLTILWKQPASSHDRDHRVRLAWGVPLPDWHHAFEQRFGLEVRTVYGLTDGGVPVYDPLVGPRRTHTAGRVLDEFEVQIDTSRCRPGDPAGVGEILVRGREPGLTMNGYYGDAGATALAVMDGWVRTGDLGQLDDDGFLAFRGRLSDSIRRRGENISALEVEEIIQLHPQVLEAAAIGVPSELTEEDVLVYVVPRPGTPPAPDEVRAHCLEHGPAYMAPRYVRLVDVLPRTPTEKVEKFRLKEQGIPPGTWDAEA